MCRTIENGGRRCPHDTSTARRLRRKNTKLGEIKKRPQVRTPHVEPHQNITLTSCIEKAHDLQQKLAQGPEENENETIFYSRLEQETTALGEEIGALADQMVGYTPADVERLVKAKEKEIYNPLNEKLTELEIAVNEAYTAFENQFDGGQPSPVQPK